MPSLARTHRSSVPEPDWNVVWPSCAAVTSIAMPVAWATPFTIQCPLAASAVESQNWYLAIVSPSASLTLNSDDARALAPCATWSDRPLSPPAHG